MFYSLINSSYTHIRRKSVYFNEDVNGKILKSVLEGVIAVQITAITILKEGSPT